MITRLHVKNYKGLASVVDSLNVLVGANGSGKSSLVDVLCFIRDALSSSLDAAISKRHGMSAIRRWSAKGQAFDVTITLDVQASTWQGQYELVLGSETRSDYRIKQERIQCRMPQDMEDRKPSIAR